MFVPFLTARRRRRMLDRPLDAQREKALTEQVALFRRLPDAAKAKLRDFARVLVAEKNWEGCGGLELNDEIIPARFTFDKKHKQIHLLSPFDNRGVTPARLRQEIVALDAVMRRTEPAWNPKNFGGESRYD